jgi:hypothetical protein
MKQNKHSIDFGKKEKVLNYACQTYQLSRPNKVGTVMALIRECQPQTIADWEEWYFENAYTGAKTKDKITIALTTFSTLQSIVLSTVLFVRSR